MGSVNGLERSSGTGGIISRRRSRGPRIRDNWPETCTRSAWLFIIAGIEGAILSARVDQDPSILDGCFDELKRHVGMYRPD